MPFLRLTSQPLTSPYGWRVLPGVGRTFHKGADFAFSYRMPISVCGDGVVTEAGVHREYGKYVRVDHGAGVTTSYHSADELCVKVGDRVRLGDTIALAGRSAMGATGPHLHLGLWLDGQHTDPLQYLTPGETRPIREPNAIIPPALVPENGATDMADMTFIRDPADGTIYLGTGDGLTAIADTRHLSLLQAVAKAKPGEILEMAREDLDTVNGYLWNLSSAAIKRARG